MASCLWGTGLLFLYLRLASERFVLIAGVGGRVNFFRFNPSSFFLVSFGLYYIISDRKPMRMKFSEPYYSAMCLVFFFFSGMLFAHERSLPNSILLTLCYSQAGNYCHVFSLFMIEYVHIKVTEKLPTWV